MKHAELKTDIFCMCIHAHTAKDLKIVKIDSQYNPSKGKGKMSGATLHL
jgi:hypothetical protein